MMTQQQLTDREAAEVCLRRNIPFALYSLPGSTATRFMAAPPDEDGECRAPLGTPGDCFFISRFAADEPYMAGVAATWTAADVLAWAAAHPDTSFAAARELPYKTSTHRASWDMAFRNMRGRLRRQGGKVVLSRHTALFSTRSLVGLAEAYMALNPDNFGYLCFTPETGVWYGSTPELLLETGETPDEYRTMALAGTRWSDDAPWDAKNLSEHATVVAYISGVLASQGLEVESEECRTLLTNGVEHLCTPITARGDADFGRLLSALNPTPAVAGVPLETALAEIDIMETHQRRCYAGAVGVCTGGRIHAYVNLRCAFAAPAEAEEGRLHGWIHNVYSGGGLMADSDPDTEWEELERKSSFLIKTIDGGMWPPDVVYDPAGIPFTNTVEA